MFCVTAVLVKTASANEKKWLRLDQEFLQENIYGYDEQWPVLLAGGN
jgi:hypothetical protein